MSNQQTSGGGTDTEECIEIIQNDRSMDLDEFHKRQLKILNDALSEKIVRPRDQDDDEDDDDDDYDDDDDMSLISYDSLDVSFEIK